MPGVRYSAAVGIDSERTGTQRLHVVAEVRDERRADDGWHRELVTRDRPARAPRRAATGPRAVLLVRAEHHPEDVERQDPALAAGADDRGRRAAGPRWSTGDDRLSSAVHLPVYGPAAPRASRCIALRAARGGARLRLAVGERSRRDPVARSARAIPTTPPATFPLPPDDRLPRAAHRARARGRRHRAHRGSARACSCCPTAIRCSPPRCSRRSTTWRPAASILGAGVGWMREEIELLGVPYDRRGAWSDEAIRVMRACWTRGARALSRRVLHASTTSAAARGPPRGTIPIWIGGHTERALRRVAELGDGWHAAFPTRRRHGRRPRRSCADACAQGRPRPRRPSRSAPGWDCPPSARPTTSLDELRALRDLGVDHVILEPAVRDVATMTHRPRTLRHRESARSLERRRGTSPRPTRSSGTSSSATAVPARSWAAGDAARSQPQASPQRGMGQSPLRA